MLNVVGAVCSNIHFEAFEFGLIAETCYKSCVRQLEELFTNNSSLEEIRITEKNALTAYEVGKYRQIAQRNTFYKKQQRHKSVKSAAKIVH